MAELADNRAPVQPSRTPALMRAVRPRQWTKNLLVLSAPLAAGRILELDVLVPALLAGVAFLLASSAVYLLNDALDVDEDRRHPTKRHRPVAAGELSLTRAVVVALVCAVLALVLAWWINNPLLITVAAYLALQVAYSTALKHQPLVDLAVVAAGFLLRAVAGGVAAGVLLSQWFLLVAGFGSLFVVAGKRYSELISLGTGASTRRSLDRYSETYLRFVWQLSAALVIITYSLWAFDHGSPGLWAQLSIAPFTLVMLRYAMIVDTGTAGAPEELMLTDRGLQAITAVWLALILVAVMI